MSLIHLCFMLAGAALAQQTCDQCVCVKEPCLSGGSAATYCQSMCNVDRKDNIENCNNFAAYGCAVQGGSETTTAAPTTTQKVTTTQATTTQRVETTTLKPTTTKATTTQATTTAKPTTTKATTTAKPTTTRAITTAKPTTTKAATTAKPTTTQATTTAKATTTKATTSHHSGNVPEVPAEVVGQFVHMAAPPAGGDAFKQGQGALNAPAIFSGASDWERAMAALLGREHAIKMDKDYADNDVDMMQKKDRRGPNFGCYDTALPGSKQWPDYTCDNFKDWNHADQFKLSFVTVGGNGQDGKKFTIPTAQGVPCSNPVQQQWFDPANPTKCITGNDNGAWSTQILDEYYLNRHSGVDFTAEFKKNGFNAIMFDIEEVHQADGSAITRADQMDEAIAKFQAVFKKAADAGILVAITTSWCGPFGLNGVPDMKLKLVKSWAADDNVHMLVPQMYTNGDEGFNKACTKESCPSATCSASEWKAMFNNDKQAIVPAIGKAGEWPQWKNWLSQMEVEHRAKGFFQWLQPTSFDMFKKATTLLI